MFVRRLIPVCLLALAGLAWAQDVRPDAPRRVKTPLPSIEEVREEEVPPDVKRLIEENDKTSADILKKAEDALRKAQEDHEKAVADIKSRKEKLIAQLEELAKRLEKEGKLPQARVVAEQAEELRTGRVAGAQNDPGTLTGFRDQTGKGFLFQVTGTLNGGSVWGTDIYTDDSHLATAAVHAGVLKPGETGILKVTLLPGQATYDGTARNGVSSSGYGAWTASFKVELSRRVKKATGKEGGQALADPGTLQNFRGQLGKALIFEVTGNATGAVWGTGVYTDDSTLATAAVHAGVLKAGQKGLVKVTILPGEESYTASTQNGIESGEWGQWTGSYKVEAVKK